MKEMIDALRNVMQTKRSLLVRAASKLCLSLTTKSTIKSVSARNAPGSKLPSVSGLGGVEMFAMGLKAMGAYLCRTLSYRDAEFRLETIDIDPAFNIPFTDECSCCITWPVIPSFPAALPHRILYDRSTQYWSLLLSVLNCLPKPMGGRDMRKGLFWAAHQRFYKGLLIAAKVRGRVPADCSCVMQG
eukprot:scaffold90207_cov22-Tisochrysis_lutea.AAC.1